MSYSYYMAFGFYNKCYCNDYSCYPGGTNKSNCQFITYGEWIL